MKNFVFISPNFPLTYWKFCRELKNNGMRVLGIGDCPYDELMQDLLPRHCIDHIEFGETKLRKTQSLSLVQFSR